MAINPVYTSRYRRVKDAAKVAAAISSVEFIDINRPENRDSYIVVFQPKIHAYIELTGVFVESIEHDQLVIAIETRFRQVTSACRDTINQVFDKEPEEKDITIEFSLGAEPPSSTI